MVALAEVVAGKISASPTVMIPSRSTRKTLTRRPKTKPLASSVREKSENATGELSNDTTGAATSNPPQVEAKVEEDLAAD